MFSILRNGDALRFYGGLLHPEPSSPLPLLEWQLLTDSRTSTRTCHFQIAAPTGPDRFLEVDFVLGPFNPEAPPVPDTAVFDWHPNGFAPVSYPSPDAPRLVFAPDPAEPRDLTLLLDPATSFPCGFRARVALTPSTGNFPRTATFAFDASPVAPDAPPPALPHAPDPLPVPQRILDGDLDGVPVFAPCEYVAPVPPDTLFDHLDSLPGSEWASSALQCHARDVTFSPLLSKTYFGAVAFPLENSKPTGSILYVNPDPDLKTTLSVGPNRALAILRAIDKLPAPPPAVLFRFDSLPYHTLDRSPSALYLCDYPATWFPSDTCCGGPRPAVDLTHAAAEFTATMACLLHRRGIPVLVTCPPWAPYLSYHADATLPPKSLAPGVPPPAPLPPSPSGRGPAVGRRGSGGGAPGLQPLHEAASPAAAPQPPPPPPTNN